MIGQEKHRGPRNMAMMLDGIHIIMGFLIVIMAIITFLNPESNMILFPVIFLLSATLNILNGVYQYKQSGREKKKKVAGMGQILIAIFLFLVAIVSAVSIWR